MKRILMLVLVLSLILGCSAAIAEDPGIQFISGPATEEDTVVLDNWKEGQTAKISGYADITLDSVAFVDQIETDVSSGWGNLIYDYNSGSTAEYLRIRIHILNTKKTPFNFLKGFGDVICDYGDGYQFGGWARQEWLYRDRHWVVYKTADDSYEINPLYDGYFDVIVTLPNYVVESKEPLSVTFSIGENEFTVHVRK